jgi:hypothetical protein
MPEGAALNALVQIHDRLLEVGDDRFPFIHYATADELNATQDDEP